MEPFIRLGHFSGRTYIKLLIVDFLSSLERVSQEMEGKLFFFTFDIFL